MVSSATKRGQQDPWLTQREYSEVFSNIRAGRLESRPVDQTVSASHRRLRLLRALVRGPRYGPNKEGGDVEEVDRKTDPFFFLQE